MVFLVKIVLAVLFVIVLFAQPFILAGFSMEASYLISTLWLVFGTAFGSVVGRNLRNTREAYEKAGFYGRC